MNNSTVAHRWFHQIGNKVTGENSVSSQSMFYRNKIIYSYGHHYAIAIRFDNLVLVNSKGYSNSTSKHTNHVLSSVDRCTHKVIYLPLKRAYNFDSRVSFKDAYKYIDFNNIVNDFDVAVKKLSKARKPQIYLNDIECIKNKLDLIFKTFRGSKTYAIKNVSKIRLILSFTFDNDTKQKLKDYEKRQKQKEERERKKNIKNAKKELSEYEQGYKKYISNYTLGTLNLNTVIRVIGEHIHTSKGAEIELRQGIAMFKLWEGKRALNVEINSNIGTFKCTKADKIIKFGCHEVEYNQAKRVLTPYLK